MATQEPNVYAGLSVVIGGLMHARPKFFAKVMGELLFWVGEDKMTFGSDYGIWEPKWQIEGFVDWDYPSDEFSDYPRVNVDDQEEDPRPERRQALRHRGAGGVPARRPTPGRRPPRTTPQLVDAREPEPRCDRRRARCWPPWTRCATRSWTSRSPRSASCRRAPCPRTGMRSVRLRLPTYFCAPNFAFLMVADAYDAVSARARACAGPRWCSRTTSPPTRSTAGSPRGPASPSPSTARPTDELDELRTDFVRKAVLAGTDRVCRPLLAAGGRRTSWPAMTLGDVPPSPDAGPAARAPGRAGPAGRRRRGAAGRRRRPARRSASRRCRCTCARPG